MKMVQYKHRFFYLHCARSKTKFRSNFLVVKYFHGIEKVILPTFKVWNQAIKEASSYNKSFSLSYLNGGKKLLSTLNADDNLRMNTV